jgi:hypothetical protein
MHLLTAGLGQRMVVSLPELMNVPAVVIRPVKPYHCRAVALNGFAILMPRSPLKYKRE